MLLSRDPTASVLPSGEYLIQLIHFLDSNSVGGYNNDEKLQKKYILNIISLIMIIIIIIMIIIITRIIILTTFKFVDQGDTTFRTVSTVNPKDLHFT